MKPLKKTRGQRVTRLSWGTFLSNNKETWTKLRLKKQVGLKLLLFRWGFSFDQTSILFLQGCFVPSSVEIRRLVLEKKNLKYRQCIFAIISPWKRALSFLWINNYSTMLNVPNFVDINPVVLEKIKMGKVYKQTDGRTDRQTPNN